jgi:hypothetical protein
MPVRLLILIGSLIYSGLLVAQSAPPAQNISGWQM